MMPEMWIWNNKFRVCGVLLAMAFHVVMFVWAINESNPEVGGYRWMFSWYMPAMVLGFPWSILAFFMGALIPGGSVLGLALAVCVNGYLLGWPIDAMVNHSRRFRQRREFETYFRTNPGAPHQV